MSLRLSVVVVVFNMERELPRTLRALSPAYQQGVSRGDYEVIVVDNGSSRSLPVGIIDAADADVRLIRLEDAPPSPARAINAGVEAARGEVVAIMVDGAHILTPGVFSHALDMFSARPNPLVVVAPFFLGPGPQTRTVAEGYDQREEDRLLDSIDWPAQGYRLFEIGVPYRIVEDPETRPRLFWFVRQFESNCLLVRKSAFERVRGCDERFDFPGGGALLPDLYRRLCDLDDAEIVQLMGEGSFHQVHGGVSTNTSAQDQRRQWESYLAQYRTLRGVEFEVSQKPIRYYGRMPNRAATQLMKTG